MSLETIGNFEFNTESLLGKGAWDEVYLGRQISLNRPVAIKILKTDLTQKARVYYRDHYLDYERNEYVGFRCVKSVE